MLRLLFSICAFLILANTYSQANFDLYTIGEDPNGNYAPIHNLGSTGLHYLTGYTAIADFNGDGMPDAIQDGATNSPRIWMNDGNGNLTEPIEGPSGFSLSVSKFIADFDEDGDQDIFYAKGFFLYNDGAGNFTVVQDSAILPKYNADIDFKELDGEEGREIIVSNTIGFNRSIDVYRRNSDGTYEAILNFDLTGVSGGGFHCADLDNDNDNDIIVYGHIYQSDMTKFNLYRNDGFGSFVLDTPIMFDGLSYGVIESTDLNEDGLTDLVMSGSFVDEETSEDATRIYLGDVEEEFVEVLDHGIIGTISGGMELSDFNDDGEIDILIGGNATYSGSAQTKLYLQSDGEFTEDTINAFPPSFHPTFQRMDNDGDGDMDLFMEGTASYGVSVPYSRIYVNNGNGGFSEVVSDKHIARNLIGYMVNTEGDERPELHFTGITDEIQYQKLSYSVTESGQLVESENHLPLYSTRASYFFDMDADGDLDVIQRPSVLDSADYMIDSSVFFRNQGDGSYVADSVGGGSFGYEQSFFVDLNNDSYPDILTKYGHVHMNNGGINFEQIDSPFYAYETDFFPSDIDNDGDVDVISVTDAWTNVVFFYINDGDANFEINEEMTFDFGSNGTYDQIITRYVKTADLDGDGDSDLLIKTNSANGIGSSGMRVFMNEDSGFIQSQHIGPTDTGVHKLTDLDNDGDLDVFTSRQFGGENSIYTFYNDGTGHFFEQGSDQFDEFKIYSLWIDDLEGDGDVDILYTGTDISGRISSRLYINSTNVLSAKDEDTTVPVFSIYPNPTNGSFRIDSEELIQSAAVFDINGRQVFHSTSEVNSKQFEETLNLSDGIYILRVTFENNSIASKKLIVANK